MAHPFLPCPTVPTYVLGIVNVQSVLIDLSSGNQFIWDFIWYKLYTCVAEVWKCTIQTGFIGTASGQGWTFGRACFVLLSSKRQRGDHIACWSHDILPSDVDFMLVLNSQN